MQEMKQPPPDVLAWPQWQQSPDGRTVLLSGRHLTILGYRVSVFIAWIFALAFWAFPIWYYWGWQNRPPDWSAVPINLVAHRLGYWPAFDQRKWIYAGLWLVVFFFLSTIRRLIAKCVRPLTWRRSSVLFMPDTVQVSRGRIRQAWSFNRQMAEITFVLMALPNRSWRLKPQLTTEGELGSVYGQAQILYLQFGRTLTAVGEFALPPDAIGFLQNCLSALEYTAETRF